MTKVQFKKFQKSYENLLGIEAGEAYDGEKLGDAAHRIVEWTRDWVEECAQSLERDFLINEYRSPRKK